MKNTFIITLFFALGITSLQAQTSNRYDWGIEGGPNLSTFRAQEMPFFDISPAVYGSGGFIFQYNTKKILSFKTGFSYQRKGYQIKGLTFTDVDGNYLETGKAIVSLDYITLPLLVKASFGKKTQFFINAGPYGGFLLSAKGRYIYNGQENQKETFTNDVQRWDFGVASGIGIAIPIKEAWKIHAELRNYFGLIDLSNSGGGTGIYTNTTDLRLGVVYRLGFRE
ncbi:porin family protein [Fluviicola sp.]|uniref:porin family protein n=1 Tax=Fluviicola sp. TaxID=1917219 RepID=UPI0031E0CFD1